MELLLVSKKYGFETGHETERLKRDDKGQGAVAPWEHATLVSDFQSLRGFEPRQVQQSFSSQRVALLTEYHSACLNRYYDLNITHRTEGVTHLVIQDMGGLVYESRPTVCGAPLN